MQPDPSGLEGGLEIALDRITEDGAITLEGRWFPEDVAAALVDAVSAITAYADSSGWVDRKDAWRDVHASLDRLDAARTSSRGGAG